MRGKGGREAFFPLRPPFYGLRPLFVAHMGCGASTGPASSASSSVSPTKDGSFLLLQGAGTKSSKQSVNIVLNNPFIREGLLKFLASDAVFAEDIVRFFKDLTAIKEVGAEDDALPGLCGLIIKDYFRNEQLCEQLAVDRVSVDDAIKICDPDPHTGEPRQKDRKVLRSAFNAIWAKVLARLRLEYVPRFLVSEEFKAVKAQFEEAGGTKDPVKASVEAMEDLDVEYIMRQPLALDCFETYVRRTQMLGSGGDDGGDDSSSSSSMLRAKRADDAYTLICLVQEIYNFQTSDGQEQLFKRASKIHQRYADSRALLKKELSEVRRNYDPVLRSCYTCLQTHMVGFSQSSWYRRYLILTLGSQEVAELLSNDDQPAIVSKKSMRQLETLEQVAEERGYEETFAEGGAMMDSDEAFEQFLASGLLHYFKKFAIMNYNAENILFWLEAEEFGRGNYVNPKHGSFMPGVGIMDEQEAQRKRAQRIFDKFLATWRGPPRAAGYP